MRAWELSKDSAKWPLVLNWSQRGQYRPESWSLVGDSRNCEACDFEAVGCWLWSGAEVRIASSQICPGREDYRTLPSAEAYPERFAAGSGHPKAFAQPDET